jgi:thiol-disulfide isomerase/thioredoxin
MKKVLALCGAVILLTLGVIRISAYSHILSAEYVTDITDVASFYEITDGFIYFGRPTCPSCELFLPLLTDIANTERVSVAYFNTDYFRENNLIPEEELQNIFSKYQIIKIPMLVKLVSGGVDSAYGAEFNEDESARVRTQIQEFINYEEYPSKYIPHYAIIIMLFIISMAIVISLIAFSRKIHNQAIAIMLSMVCVAIDVTFVLLISPIMDFVDRHALSVDVKYTIAMLVAFCANIVSIAVLLFAKRRSAKVLGEYHDTS